MQEKDTTRSQGPKVIHGAEIDNVVTCCTPIVPGEIVTIGNLTVTALQPIPIYHKMAITDIRAGEKVFKYGQPIGAASCDILKGQHVHVQNLESDRGRGDRKGGQAR